MDRTPKCIIRLQKKLALALSKCKELRVANEPDFGQQYYLINGSKDKITTTRWGGFENPVQGYYWDEDAFRNFRMKLKNGTAFICKKRAEKALNKHCCCCCCCHK